MILLVLSTEIEIVQDLALFWTWNAKFCKLLRKNRTLVADDLHKEWAFPDLQFGGRRTNGDYILISSKCPTLKPQDRRIAFCQWLLQKICEKPNLLHIVLTTDEAGFTRDGVFSLH
jgi:hypothetical protein